MKRRFYFLFALSALGAQSLVGCNLGPFPDFLEELDPLDPVNGEVEGWIAADEEKTQVLVLSKSGRFLHSIVARDTSVELKIGSFAIEKSELTMAGELRYIFPTESGPVKDRLGAQSSEIDARDSYPASEEEGRLLVDGLGDFIRTTDFLGGLNLGTRAGRGCLLRFAQLSVRTAQSRIRNLGGGGTVIYHNNKSTFAGFLSGEISIVMDNLLSPDTTIAYDRFQDFPEVRFDDSFVSHVNTSGDGTLDESIAVTILVEEQENGSEMGLGGGMGAGGASSSEGSLLARGRLVYGPEDPITIDQGDVVGGSYEFVLDYPKSTSDKFSWEFLQDLDLSSCGLLTE